MSSTPNLLLSHIAASQNQKEVTANTAFDGLDEGFNSGKTVVMTDADYTFAGGAGADFFSFFFFEFTGTITATRAVNLPTGSARLFAIVNGTTNSPTQEDLIVKVGTGTQTVTLSDGEAHLLWSDGVGNVWKLS
jgi:hypothetical protein